jgi:hypothetical protein
MARRSGFATAAASAAGLLLVSGLGIAAPDPVKTCQAAKTSAAGDRAACLADEQAKALQGKASNPGKCEATFDAAIAKANADAARKGAACRFLDNGDGTISDLDHLLAWEKKTGDSTSIHYAFIEYDWFDALAWPANLNVTASQDAKALTGGFAGKTDWRLPTIVELQTLIDLTKPGCAQTVGQGNCIFDAFNTDPTNTFAPDGTWALTTYVVPEDGTVNGWFVDFGDGVVNTFQRLHGSNFRAIRAVRGGR